MFNTTAPRIARVLVIGLLAVGCRGLQASEETEAGLEGAQNPQTEAIESFVRDLYRAFCFDPNEEADWEGMRALFHDEACFASPIRVGSPVKVQGIEGFLKDFRDWVQNSEVGRTGLHERILSTRVDCFANIAHVYVTFEGVVPGELEAQTLGVDSLQLVLEEGRWQLVSFTSQYVSDAVPLPPQFAPPQLGSGAE
jgi:hypothetical protein